MNYFIINTAQFLNNFSQVSETKLNEVDDKLDKIEQILALYEAKLDSVPEEFFEDLPEIPIPQVQPEIARTQNPLLNAQKPAAALPPTLKESAVIK